MNVVSFGGTTFQSARVFFVSKKSRSTLISSRLSSSASGIIPLCVGPFGRASSFGERREYDFFNEAMPQHLRCRHFKRRRRFETTSHCEDDVQNKTTTTPLHPPSVDRTQKKRRRGGERRRRREETAARTGGVGIQVLIRRGVPGVPLAESRIGRYDSECGKSCCV